MGRSKCRQHLIPDKVIHNKISDLAKEQMIVKRVVVYSYIIRWLKCHGTVRSGLQCETTIAKNIPVARGSVNLR